MTAYANSRTERNASPWWIDDVNYQSSMLDKVNATIEDALDEYGIEMRFPTYNLNLIKD